MSLARETLVTILQAALDEPYGILLQTSDPGRARAALYKARTEEGDPRLSTLQIRISPFPDGDLVICHVAPARRRPPPNLEDLPE